MNEIAEATVPGSNAGNGFFVKIKSRRAGGKGKSRQKSFRWHCADPAARAGQGQTEKRQIPVGSKRRDKLFDPVQRYFKMIHGVGIRNTGVSFATGAEGGAGNDCTTRFVQQAFTEFFA